MRTINKIIVHCTATPAGRITTVSDVDRWHKEKGWSGIGYHYLIGLNGEIWKGRPEESQGAHTLNHNHDSVGVCYVGGGMGNATDTRTGKQKMALTKLIKELKQKYPKAVVYSHKDLNATTCPGFDAKSEYNNL